MLTASGGTLIEDCLQADLGNVCKGLGQRAVAFGGRGDLLEPGFVNAGHAGLRVKHAGGFFDHGEIFQRWLK